MRGTAPARDLFDVAPLPRPRRDPSPVPVQAAPAPEATSMPVNGLTPAVLKSWLSYIASAHPLLPVLWPEGAGAPHAEAVCGCCRCRKWDLHEGWWLCRVCHP